MRYAVVLAMLTATACTVTKPYARPPWVDSAPSYTPYRRRDAVIRFDPPQPRAPEQVELVTRYSVAHNPDDLPELEPTERPADPEPDPTPADSADTVPHYYDPWMP